MAEQDGITSEWHASEEILKDFIGYGRLAQEALDACDLPTCYRRLKSMYVTIDAFIKNEQRQKIQGQLARCLQAADSEMAPSLRIVEMFSDCDMMIRRAAQGAKLLIKEADSWDVDQDKNEQQKPNSKKIKGYEEWLRK